MSLENEGGAEPTLADSAGDAFDEAFSGVETSEGTREPASAKLGEEPAPSTFRDDGRDEHGRFTPKPKTEGVGDNQAPVSDPTQQPTPPPAPVDPRAPNVAQPPSSWKAEARAGWETLPEHVRAEVWRREQDMHAGFAQYRDAATFGGELAKVLAPYADEIRAAGITPAQATAELFQLRKSLATDPRGALQQLAQDHGVDLWAAPEPGQATDPTIQALKRELGELKRFVNGQQEQTAAAQQREANEAIAAFERDTTNYPHYPELKAEMSRLLLADLARNLEDAYEQASWRVPAVREKILAEQQDAARKEAERKAAEAKAAASVNIARRGNLTPANPVGKMEDTIGAVWDQAMRGL